MSKALQPRATEEGSQYRWLKGGLRLLGRSSASWLLVWLVWATGLLLLIQGQSILALLLMGISMVTFDLNVLAFDQVASSRPRMSKILPGLWTLLSRNARLYMRAFLVRMAAVVLMVCFTAGVLWALQEYSGTKPPSTPASHGMFGVPWDLWTYAWFLPSLFQRGGVISMRPWLMRRHGLSEEHSSALQVLAILRNHKQVLSFQRWITLPSLASVLFFPILLPVLELLWVASMRCMYHDLFEGGMGIQEQKQEETASAPQVVLLPVAR